MSRYTSVTEQDRQAMLEAIGASSVDELFEQVPAELRLERGLDIEGGKPEQEVFRELSALAARNADAESHLCFLGAGMYDHYVPAIVDAITSRSEFLTPYTPYQPEVSQGGLQVMFEFQTAICELTGMDVSNASVYDGPSAAASAAYLAAGARKGRERLVVSRGLHPHTRAALATHAAGFGLQITEVGLERGLTDRAALEAELDETVAAVFVQNPNFLGGIEDLATLAEVAHPAGALIAAAVDPVTLTILKPPGECGVDIAFGEGQPLGNRLDFGGPSFGFFAARNEFLRRMPGRIAGETTDLDGRRGFVLALQAREQHIRREKATNNICTAQALNALAGVIYLSWLGREGAVKLGRLLAARTAYARRRVTAIDGVELLHDAPVMREFAVAVDADVDKVLAACAEAGVLAGYPLARDYPEYGNGLLIAITEQRGRGDIDRLAEVLERAVRGNRRRMETVEDGPAVPGRDGDFAGAVAA